MTEPRGSTVTLEALGGGWARVVRTERLVDGGHPGTRGNGVGIAHLLAYLCSVLLRFGTDPIIYSGAGAPTYLLASRSHPNTGW